MNLGGSISLLHGPLTGTWYRAFHPRYLASPLATAHSAAISSRYNEGTAALPQFEVLYLAEDHQVALHEVGAIVGLSAGGRGGGRVIIPNPSVPWAILPIQVLLHNVADLTRPSQLKLLQTTAQEMTGDWRGNFTRTPSDSVSQPVGTAPTQELGQALFSLPGLEGFQTISAKVPERRILVVFPTKLGAGGLVRYFDPATGREEKILPSAIGAP
jgi:hypothetical protein